MRHQVGSKIYINNGELTYEALVVDDTLERMAVCLVSSGQPIYFYVGSTKSSGERYSLGVLPGSLVLFYGGSFIRLERGQTKVPPNRDVSP